MFILKTTVLGVSILNFITITYFINSTLSSSCTTQLLLNLNHDFNTYDIIYHIDIYWYILDRNLSKVYRASRQMKFIWGSVTFPLQNNALTTTRYKMTTTCVGKNVAQYERTKLPQKMASGSVLPTHLSN